MAGGASALPVVETMTENGAGFAVETVSELGETLQMVARGAPVQESETIPLNPVPGASCKEY